MNQLEQTLEGSETPRIDDNPYAPPRVECIMKKEGKRKYKVKLKELLKKTYKTAIENSEIIGFLVGGGTAGFLTFELTEIPAVHEYMEPSVAMTLISLTALVCGLTGTKLVDKIDTYLHKNNLFPYSENH